MQHRKQSDRTTMCEYKDSVTQHAMCPINSGPAVFLKWWIWIYYHYFQRGTRSSTVADKQRNEYVENAMVWLAEPLKSPGIPSQVKRNDVGINKGLLNNWQRRGAADRDGHQLNQYKHAFPHVDHHTKFDHSWRSEAKLSPSNVAFQSHSRFSELTRIDRVHKSSN